MTKPNRLSANSLRDLVPWADPYIAALIEKLRNADDSSEERDRFEAADKLPPPLDNEDAIQDIPWQADWSPRSWPRP